MEPYNWCYENSISQKTPQIDLEDGPEHKYSAFRTNRYFSNFVDTVLYANEMNMAFHLDPDMQYDYLYHSIRKGKRFYKKIKGVKTDDFTVVQNFYKYNAERTREALRLLTPAQVDIIRQEQEKVNHGHTRHTG